MALDGDAEALAGEEEDGQIVDFELGGEAEERRGEEAEEELVGDEGDEAGEELEDDEEGRAFEHGGGGVSVRRILRC